VGANINIVEPASERLLQITSYFPRTYFAPTLTATNHIGEGIKNLLCSRGFEKYYFRTGTWDARGRAKAD
jgi:hypothetical protein